MDAWLIWLVAGCVLGVGEMHQGGFYLAPFALGAGVAAIVSLIGSPNQPGLYELLGQPEGDAGRLRQHG